MRILVLNPNTSLAITDRLAGAARKVAAPGTIISTATATRGVPYIATRAEAQIGGAIALEMLAERDRDCDAAVIAAFGDPGLFGARELFDFPVVGMAEASMLTACMLGRRFAIVTFARALGPWYQECVDMHGMTGRCAGIRMLDDRFRSIGDVQDEKESLLAETRGEGSARTRGGRDHPCRRAAGRARGANPRPDPCSGCRSNGGRDQAGRGAGCPWMSQGCRWNVPPAGCQADDRTPGLARRTH